MLTDQGTQATLECVIDANPLTADMVTWSRPGYEMTRTTTEFSDQKSVLQVANVTKEDSGLFTCTVNNGIGDAAEATAQLIVKCEFTVVEIRIESHFVTKQYYDMCSQLLGNRIV